MIKTLLLLLVYLGYAQQKLSLDQAIDIALEKNFQHRIVFQNIEYSNKHILQGYLNFAPVVTFDHSIVELSDYSLQQALIQQDGFKQILTAVGFPDIAEQIPNTAFRKVFRSSLTANWNLFARGLALRELNERKLRSKILDIEADQSKLNTVFSVREAYYNLYIAKELKKIAELRKQNTTDRVRQIKQFVDNGLRNNAELLRWQLQDSQSDEQLIDANTGLDIAKKNFVFVLGEDLEQEYDIIAPNISEKLFTDMNQDIIKNVSYEDINENRKQMLEFEIAKDNKFYTYGKFLPSVNVKWQKNWQQFNKAFPAEQPWELSLNFSWEIFSSFKDYLELEKNEILAMTAELRKEETERQIRVELFQLYANLEKSRKSLNSSQRSVALAEQNYQTSTNRYDNGLATNIDLIDSQIQLNQSQLDALQAYRNYVLAGYALKRLLGKY